MRHRLLALPLVALLPALLGLTACNGNSTTDAEADAARSVAHVFSSEDGVFGVAVVTDAGAPSPPAPAIELVAPADAPGPLARVGPGSKLYSVSFDERPEGDVFVARSVPHTQRLHGTRPGPDQLVPVTNILLDPSDDHLEWAGSTTIAANDDGLVAVSHVEDADLLAGPEPVTFAGLAAPLVVDTADHVVPAPQPKGDEPWSIPPHEIEVAPPVAPIDGTPGSVVDDIDPVVVLDATWMHIPRDRDAEVDPDVPMATPRDADGHALGPDGVPVLAERYGIRKLETATFDNLAFVSYLLLSDLEQEREWEEYEREREVEVAETSPVDLTCDAPGSVRFEVAYNSTDTLGTALAPSTSALGIDGPTPPHALLLPNVRIECTEPGSRVLTALAPVDWRVQSIYEGYDDFYEQTIICGRFRLTPPDPAWSGQPFAGWTVRSTVDGLNDGAPIVAEIQPDGSFVARGGNKVKGVKRWNRVVVVGPNGGPKPEAIDLTPLVRRTLGATFDQSREGVLAGDGECPPAAR